MVAKYRILSFVNKKHMLLTRFLFGFGGWLIVLLATQKIVLSNHCYKQAINDDFKYLFRLLLKIIDIRFKVKIIKDRTLVFVENMNQQQVDAFISFMQKAEKKNGKSINPNFDRFFLAARSIEINSTNTLQEYRYFTEFTRKLLDSSECKPDVNKSKSPFEADAENALKDWINLFPLNKHGWFCISGTFLGAVREGKFLAHDYDLDFGIFEKHFNESDFRAKIKLSNNFFLKSVGHIKQGNFSNGQYTSDAPKPSLFKIIHRTGVNIDFFIHFCDLHECIHGSQYFLWANTKFSLKKYTLAGCHVYGPDNANIYLTENYGDWRTPKTDFSFRSDTPNISFPNNPIGLANSLKNYYFFFNKEQRPQQIRRIKKNRLFNQLLTLENSNDVK